MADPRPTRPRRHPPRRTRLGVSPAPGWQGSQMLLSWWDPISPSPTRSQAPSDRPRCPGWSRCRARRLPSLPSLRLVDMGARASARSQARSKAASLAAVRVRPRLQVHSEYPTHSAGRSAVPGRSNQAADKLNVTPGRGGTPWHCQGKSPGPRPALATAHYSGQVPGLTYSGWN